VTLRHEVRELGVELPALQGAQPLQLLLLLHAVIALAIPSLRRILTHGPGLHAFRRECDAEALRQRRDLLVAAW
jgi:hypothetical protein